MCDVVELNVVEGFYLRDTCRLGLLYDLDEGQTATITTIDNIEPLSLAPDGRVTVVGLWTVKLLHLHIHTTLIAWESMEHSVCNCACVREESTIIPNNSVQWRDNGSD